MVPLGKGTGCVFCGNLLARIYCCLYILLELPSSHAETHAWEYRLTRSEPAVGYTVGQHLCSSSSRNTALDAEIVFAGKGVANCRDDLPRQSHTTNTHIVRMRRKFPCLFLARYRLLLYRWRRTVLVLSYIAA